MEKVSQYSLDGNAAHYTHGGDFITLVRALGGKLVGERRGVCFCPAHHDHKTPNLHISIGNKQNVIFICRAGCSQQKLIAAFRERGLWPLKGSRASSNHQSIPDQQHEQADKLMQAVAILRAAAGVNGKPPKEWPRKWTKPTDYLKHRGIENVPANAMLLSRASAHKLAQEPEPILGFKPYPAMVLPIIGANGLQGASVTYLTRDGTSNAVNKDNKKVRRIYGTTLGGSVQLGEIDPDHPPDVVLVAEGIEDALTASQLTGYPAIAVLSAGNYQKITPPPCKHLIIAADNDEIGKEKATAAAALWSAQGRSVRIAIPEQHKDWNDAIRDRNADPEKLQEVDLERPASESQPGSSRGRHGAVHELAISTAPISAQTVVDHHWPGHD